MMRIVDLFCGIGGVAEAVQNIDSMKVAAAIDIDRQSNRVYEFNHGIQPQTRTLESIESIPPCDLLWLSPPCQPYTRRGKRRHEADPRSQALQHLIPLIGIAQPSSVVLENVPEFQGSTHHRWLTSLLHENSYTVREEILCPTQWKVPMRRRRFYLRACRQRHPLPELNMAATGARLSNYLDHEAWNHPELLVEPELLRRYAGAIDVVSADDPTAVTACFTSAYGKSPVRAGSYLRCSQSGQVRRFAAEEIARLMGFGDSFHWPAEFSQRSRYSMIGNALSVTVVRGILQSLLTG